MGCDVEACRLKRWPAGPLRVKLRNTRSEQNESAVGVLATKKPATWDVEASGALVNTALAQIGKEAGEDCRDVRGRRRRDIDLPRWGEGCAGIPELKTAPFGAPSTSCPVFRRPLLLFAVHTGGVRLASKSGATADIPELPLRAIS